MKKETICTVWGEKRESQSVINGRGLDSKWNKRRGNLRTRPHPANPATHERKGLRDFLGLNKI